MTREQTRKVYDIAKAAIARLREVAKQGNHEKVIKDVLLLEMLLRAYSLALNRIEDIEAALASSDREQERAFQVMSDLALRRQMEEERERAE
jgi:hypothetical protein